MATLNAYSQLTLVEVAKRIDPNGEQAAIAEVLAQENEILMDAPWVQANDTFSHKCTRRTSLPSGSWRQLNAGVAAEASRTVEVMETIGSLETYSENDKLLIDSFPDAKQARNDENQGFLEGLAQTLASAVIYGNTTTTPEKFDGLAVRMGALAATQNVIGQGGSGGDTTSIFIVQWGINKVFMCYPKGSPNAGIEHRDLGEETKVASDGTMHQVYRDWFGVRCGLVVKDSRCIARLANIESAGTANTVDEDNLIKLLNRMPGAGRGASIYVNETILSQMEIALKDKTNVNYVAGKGEGLAGEPVLYFRQSPVRRVDQIVNTETAVS